MSVRRENFQRVSSWIADFSCRIPPGMWFKEVQWSTFACLLGVLLALFCVHLVHWKLFCKFQEQFSRHCTPFMLAKPTDLMLHWCHCVYAIFFLDSENGNLFTGYAFHFKKRDLFGLFNFSFAVRWLCLEPVYIKASKSKLCLDLPYQSLRWWGWCSKIVSWRTGFPLPVCW